MVFSSTVFIFIFLPFVLGVYFLLDKKLRNLFLLIASLFFYAWGEGVLVLLMMSSIGTNYVVGLLIDKSNKSLQIRSSSAFLIIGVTLNLLFLVYYKYIHFIFENLAFLELKLNFDTSSVTLPIGISFFTFQSISYLVDVHRRSVEANGVL